MLLIGQRGHAGFGRFLQVSALASHWLEDCANFTPTLEENVLYSVNHSECNTSISQSSFINEQLYSTCDQQE
jgi:hypothetical protein